MSVLGTLAKIIGFVAVGSVVVYLFKRSGAANHRPVGPVGKKREGPDVVRPPVSLPKEQYDSQKAKEEFVKVSFEGIYESLYQVAKGTSASPVEVIDDWNTRIGYLNKCPNVQNFWRSLFSDYKNFPNKKLEEAADKFMDFIFETGIKRDKRNQVTVDERTSYEYYAINNKKFVIGETMNLTYACWKLGDKVLEKGALTQL